MKLTPTQREIVVARLGLHGSAPTCQVRHAQLWVVQDIVVELRGFDAGRGLVGGPTIPLVTLGCLACGNVLFFSAVALGVVDPRTGGPGEGSVPPRPAAG